MNLKTRLGQLELLAIMEGISYISFAITVPLKRVWGIPEPNFFVGSAHGILFIAYCLWVVMIYREHKLSLKTTAILLVSSLVPFMTFWAEKRSSSHSGSQSRNFLFRLKIPIFVPDYGYKKTH